MFSGPLKKYQHMKKRVSMRMLHRSKEKNKNNCHVFGCEPVKNCLVQVVPWTVDFELPMAISNCLGEHHRPVSKWNKPHVSTIPIPKEKIYKRNSYHLQTIYTSYHDVYITKKTMLAWSESKRIKTLPSGPPQRSNLDCSLVRTRRFRCDVYREERRKRRLAEA